MKTFLSILVAAFSFANGQTTYPDSNGWNLNKTCSDEINYVIYQEVSSPQECLSTCEAELEKDKYTTPSAVRTPMCCGYKYFPTGASGISGFHQCFLTGNDNTNPDIYSQDYRKQNMFMTQLVIPDCLDDNSLSDTEGDTCTSYYNFDNSACGLYDTFDFRADRQCCECQSYMPSTKLETAKFNSDDNTQCGGLFLQGDEDFLEGSGKFLALEQKRQKDGCYDKCVTWDATDKFIFRFEDDDSMCCEFIMMENGRSACNLYHQGDSSSRKQFTRDHERLEGLIYTEFFDHVWKPTADKSWDQFDYAYWGFYPFFILSVGIIDFIGIPMFFGQTKIFDATYIVNSVPMISEDLISLQNSDDSINYGFKIWSIFLDWYPDLIRLCIHFFMFADNLPTEALVHVKKNNPNNLSRWAEMVIWLNTDWRSVIRIIFWAIFEFVWGIGGLNLWYYNFNIALGYAHQECTAQTIANVECIDSNSNEHIGGHYADTNGNSCASYTISDCGLYNSGSFNSDNCCACAPELASGSVSFTRTCYDDLTNVDSLGQDCSVYNSGMCGNYDTSNFNSWQACCSCNYWGKPVVQYTFTRTPTLKSFEGIISYYHQDYCPTDFLAFLQIFASGSLQLLWSVYAVTNLWFIKGVITEYWPSEPEDMSPTEYLEYRQKIASQAAASSGSTTTKTTTATNPVNTCFTWNGNSYQGTAPTNPVATICGLTTCTACPY